MNGKEIEGQPIVVQPSSSKKIYKFLFSKEAAEGNDEEMMTMMTVLELVAEAHNKKTNVSTAIKAVTGMLN
jgi:hypothetical protein